MERIAKFEKVSFQQFSKDWVDTFGETDNIQQIYNDIKLPKRATKGSAGYDFFAPQDFVLKPKEVVKIPTGIRVKIDESWVLQIFPRSGLGFKFRLQLNNTVGIIDSDYYNSSNEGHIMTKLNNANNEGKTLSVSKGDAFSQGIFVQYGITEDDTADAIRDGGFGSTSKK